MSRIETICLLGFGEVGEVLAEDLLRKTALNIVVWDILFPVDSAAPNLRFMNFASTHRLQKAATARAAIMQADVVISAVTASQALLAATEVARFLKHNAWYMDLNSVAPTTKHEIHNIVCSASVRFVEAAVMAPIARRRIETPILLAGPHAKSYLSVARQLGLAGVSYLSDQIGQAAASKMCRSIIVKGMEALVTEALLTARFYGVEGDVLESLNNLLPHPDWGAHAQYMISRTLEHGQRRAEEMREAAKSARAAGVIPWMSDACIERQRWAAALTTSVNRREIGDTLDAIRESCAVNTEAAPEQYC